MQVNIEIESIAEQNIFTNLNRITRMWNPNINSL